MRTLLTILATLCLLLLKFADGLFVVVPRWLHVLVLLICLISLIKPRSPREQPVRLVVAVLISIIAIALTRGDSRTRFLRDLYSVRAGMTEDQVRAVMSGYMEGTGLPPNPLGKPPEPTDEVTNEYYLVFRHSDDPAHNADWGIVHIRDGRVTRVNFSGD